MQPDHARPGPEASAQLAQDRISFQCLSSVLQDSDKDKGSSRLATDYWDQTKITMIWEKSHSFIIVNSVGVQYESNHKLGNINIMIMYDIGLIEKISWMDARGSQSDNLIDNVLQVAKCQLLYSAHLFWLPAGHCSIRGPWLGRVGSKVINNIWENFL